MIPGDNAKTMKSFNDSIQSFTTGFKSYANKADQAGGAAIRRTHEALPGIAKKGIATAKLTGKDMNQAVFAGSPLGEAVGESAMSMGKSFLGMEDKKEDESTVISATDGAGESLSQLDPQTDALEDMKRLLANIDIGLDGLVGLQTEMLAVWVDAETMERVMHEELMAESAGDRMRSIEAERERGQSSGIVPADGEGAATASTSGGGGILESLGGVMSSIPGFKTISSLFSGGLGGIAKIFGKLFFPITMLIGIVSFVIGFMEGYKEGGIIEGITQGFEALINNLVDVPLNFLKDVVAWIAGALGFEEVETLLNDFEFDISSMVRPVIDWFVELGEKISGAFTAAKDYVSDKFSGAMSFFGFGDDEEKEAKPTPASKAPEEKKLSKDEQLLQDVDEQTGVPKFMLKKHKEEYIEDEDERGRLGAMYKTNVSPTGANVMWDKENKQYKQDTRTDDERKLSNEVDEFNRSSTESLNSPEAAKKREEAMARENEMLRAEYEADLMNSGKDPRGAAAANIQNAGVESGAGGGGGGATVVIDQKDQSVSQAASNLVPMPMHTQTDPAMSQSAMVGDL